MDWQWSYFIEAALTEDIGAGDITTDNLIPAEAWGRGCIVAKEPLVVAGMDLVKGVFEFLDPDMDCLVTVADGESAAAGDVVFEVSGPLRMILTGERTALNFLQRLSGIATFTRDCVAELEGTGTRLVDTRKTTPGLRLLEKYAVRVGGAANHRMGLFDGVLIKDNHIVACGGIEKAVFLARQRVHHLVKIEVEVTSLEETESALAAGADVIMLDNMEIDMIKQAVALINDRALVEVSGSVTRQRLRELADAGADIISAGGLTHSARAVDLSMRIEEG
ncbi:MAG: carboxylating nicotinate-nucleotide diphosphorylase [Thermodesulfobacteriota bacterium]|nr:carboxylating nicotinate-nucleotide diphosphorylase [Thermodesulfobacteriota bacterium]